MQTENTTERKLPQLVLPLPIIEEIGKAKSLFKEKYGLDPELHRAAIDPSLDYPLNWWDLMDYQIYRQWQQMEAEHYDNCACLQMGWQQEDYFNSPEGKRQIEEQKREQAEIERYLAKVRAYTGQELRLEENLCIPLVYSMDEFSIKIEVISLSVKFGYPCPLTEEDLSEANARSGEIEKDHPAFIKYEDNLLEDEFTYTANLIEWEYEEAAAYLAGFVPKGYYIGIEPDFGWGVFRHGAFDGQDY